MASKINPKMIVLCTAAIGSLYTTGYLITEPAHSASIETAAIHTSSSQIQQQKKSPAKTAKYKDGTFYGEGSNRIGSVKVAVTIKNDKISAVEIAECNTRYPQRRIDPLPKQVVDRQSEKVDVVSGATRSTEDFQTAVHQALQQAAQANT
jgi:uncharacterized protein with FMN-binding domain